MSSGSCFDTLMNSDPVLDGNVETFYSSIQGPSYTLEYIIYVVLSYF